MRTVDDFARIRQAHRDGLSARQIAKQLGVGRDTIRKALQDPEPKPWGKWCQFIFLDSLGRLW
jgi:hypothetical protein